MKFLGIVIAIVLLIPLPLMWLWNALLPELFGLKEIGYLQAVGLLMLSGILFKSHATSGK